MGTLQKEMRTQRRHNEASHNRFLNMDSPRQRSQNTLYTRKRSGWEILASLVSVVAAMRISMAFNPTANFDVAGANINHMFTGILLLVGAAIPLVLDFGRGRIRTVLNLVFGAGLGLVMDEWIYLIATDGSDMAYLTPVSLWGSVFMVGIVAVFVFVLSRRA